MTFIVVIFFVTLTGLVCNTLALVTVQRSASLRVTFAATVISALAVMDSLVLVMDFLNNWVEYVFHTDLLNISRAGCTAYRYVCLLIRLALRYACPSGSGSHFLFCGAHFPFLSHYLWLSGSGFFLHLTLYHSLSPFLSLSLDDHPSGRHVKGPVWWW
jgi:hypothetical protein